MRKKAHSSWLIVHSLLIFIVLFVAHCSLDAVAYAKEVTILFTGETHAMLYPCSCPKEPDGGVARRATLIKQLGKKNPNTLVLDSGGFFAGGLMDEYTQNTELDKERTLVNLKSMELMQYDAVTIGDDEFNFGSDFLLENISKSKFVFLSCNIQSKEIAPYLIKEVAGTKFGIIGVTSLSAMQKAGGFKFVEPKIAISKAVGELKKKGASFILLLSHLGEQEDLKLISEETSGIDIIIVGHSRSKEEPSGQIGSVLVFRPSWQGRRLGKLSLVVENNKIKSYKLEELRLSDKIRDDPDILSVLPRCFSDANCKNKGLIGVCEEPGTAKARCAFNAPAKVTLQIITPKSCKVCVTQGMVDYLKKQFPGLKTAYLYYPDAKSEKLIKDLNLKGLPVYLLGKEIDKEKSFPILRDNLELKGDFYILKPQLSGFSYFIGRKEKRGSLDLFISLYDKNAREVLEVIKDFNPVVHFLAVEQKVGFEAARGNLEVEECLRSVCVQKYYPQDFWNYIACRAKNINSSWWEDCLGQLDAGRIRNCARGEEGKSLLKENIALNKELQIMFGPTYLLDNREVFGIEGVPTKEALKKIIKR